MGKSDKSVVSSLGITSIDVHRSPCFPQSQRKRTRLNTSNLVEGYMNLHPVKYPRPRVRLSFPPNSRLMHIQYLVVVGYFMVMRHDDNMTIVFSRTSADGNGI